MDVAAADSKRIYLSPAGSLSRPADDKLRIYAHHVQRRGHRDPLQWNIVADIVVNGLLLESGFPRAADGVYDDVLAHLSTESTSSS